MHGNEHEHRTIEATEDWMKRPDDARVAMKKKKAKKTEEAGLRRVDFSTGTPRAQRLNGSGALGRPAMRTVALDLGVRRTDLCEVNEAGVLERAVIRSVKDLERRLGSGTPSARVVFEACREGWEIGRASCRERVYLCV